MWQQPRNQLLPWMQSLSRRLGTLRLPSLHGQNLWISSDYVFGNDRSKFDVVAVLLATPEKSGGWESKRQLVRQKSLGQERRMSFKALGDRVRQKALVPFLLAADEIHGALFSIAIDKAVSKNFVLGPEEIELAAQQEWVGEIWKSKQLDRMLTITHFIAFLVAGLSSAGQDLMWISDQDDAFANQGLSQDTGRLFTKFLSAYSGHSYGKICIGTTAIAEPDLLEEDLAAVADIAAGGTVELLSEIQKVWQYVPGIAIELPELSTRAGVFFDWYSSRATSLTKVGCIFETSGRSLRVSTWTHE